MKHTLKLGMKTSKILMLIYLVLRIFFLNAYFFMFIKTFGHNSPFRGNASFLCIFKVAFFLFIAPAGGSNPAGQSPNLT